MPCPNPTEGEQNPTGNHVVKHNGNHVVKHNGNHVVKHDGNHVVKHDGNHVVRQNNASASRTSPGDHWACFGCRSPHAISALTSISFSSFHHLKLSPRSPPAARRTPICGIFLFLKTAWFLARTPLQQNGRDSQEATSVGRAGA